MPAGQENLRVLELPILSDADLQIKTVDGGFVVQESDQDNLDMNNLQVVTETAPTLEDLKELAFAMKVAKHVKSERHCSSKGWDDSRSRCRSDESGGISRDRFAGYGKMPRCGDGLRCLLPFKDTVELAAAACIKAIIQPGGSIRDQESIDECNKYGIAMVFTGIRHFKH